MTAASLACTCGLVPMPESFSAAISGFAALWPEASPGPGLRGVSFIRSKPSSQAMPTQNQGGTRRSGHSREVARPVVPPYARKPRRNTTPNGSVIRRGLYNVRMIQKNERSRGSRDTFPGAPQFGMLRGTMRDFVMEIEDAQSTDLPSIQAIYAYHVLAGTGTFEDVPPSLEEMTARLTAKRNAGFAWLVARDASGILGFGYYGPFRD